MNLSREACQALDAKDPLAFARPRFTLPPGVLYLDGNSLGPLPVATPARLEKAVREEWGQGLIRSWNTAGWIDQPAKLGARIARLIGAGQDEVTVADSTSVNLFKAASAAARLNPDRRVILSEPGNFPTDLYVLEGVAGQLGLTLKTVPRDEIIEALDESVAVLVLTHVHYKSGEMFDMAALTHRAQAVGALTVWDLSHSAGAVELDLTGAKADFAIGCGYKYLNGGPGAPAFIYAARRHHATLRQPLSGWMGHAAPFAFTDAYQPADGVKRLLCGTPPILAMAALEVGLEAFDGVEMREARQKSIALADLFVALVEDRLPGVFILGSPREAARRGSQISLIHEHGYEIMANLIERGVIGDFRAPDHLRFGFTPLYLRYVDVHDAVQHLQAVMHSGSWREPRFAVRAAVT